MNVPLKKRYNYGQINESLSSGATNGNPVTAGIYPYFRPSITEYLHHISQFHHYYHTIHDVFCSALDFSLS